MITFKGKTSKEMGVIIREVEHSILPGTDPKTVTLESRHGALDFGRVFNVRTIDVTMGITGKTLEEVRDKARQVASWLDSEQLEPLIDSFEPTKQYFARVDGETAVKPEHLYEEFTVSFLIPNPFASSIALSTHNLVTNGTTNVNVNGTFKVKPIVTINVTGTASSLSITNGTDNLILVDSFVSGDVVVIDCDTGKITVNGSLANILTLDSDFISLSPGTNKLTTSSGGTFKVQYNALWL